MQLRQLVFALSACLLLTACGSGGWTPPVYSGKQESTEGVPGFQNGKKQSPYVKLGQSYKVMGEWYVPRFQPDYSEVGIASWYGPGFHGRKTANGEIYDKHSMTAAHKTLPLPSIVRVTMVETGKQIIVRINDRGPFSKGRIIDLSYGAAKEIGLMQKGVAKVRVDYLLAESQRYAELLSQGRDPEAINIAREVLPHAKSSQYAKVNTAPAASKTNWWDDVKPVSSAHAATPKPLYSGSAPDAAPTDQVASRELPPATLPPPAPVAVTAPTTVASLPTAAAPVSAPPAESVFSVMDHQPPPPGHHPPPELPPRPADPPVQATAPPMGSYVQVGTYSVEGNAQAMGQRIAAIGPAQISPSERAGVTLYRVRLGPYENPEMAEEVLARVHQMGIIDARMATP